MFKFLLCLFPFYKIRLDFSYLPMILLIDMILRIDGWPSILRNASAVFTLQIKSDPLVNSTHPDEIISLVPRLILYINLLPKPINLVPMVFSPSRGIRRLCHSLVPAVSSLTTSWGAVRWETLGTRLDGCIWRHQSTCSQGPACATWL